MKKLLFILCSVLLITGCSKDDREEVSESDKMYYKSTNRFSQVIVIEDKNLQKKDIQIMDPSPQNRNPWAYDVYCPNPIHKGSLASMYKLSVDPTIDYAIHCQYCSLAYSNTGKPLNDFTEKSRIRIKFYNIIYDESLSSYVIWE